MKKIITILLLLITHFCFTQISTLNPDSTNVVLNVKAMDKNDFLNNYTVSIISNGINSDFLNIDQINTGFSLEKGKKYKIKIIKSNYSSPEYEWEFIDSEKDFRILNFQLYPSHLSEKQRLKLKKKNKKLDKKDDDGIEKTCRGMSFVYRRIVE